MSNDKHTPGPLLSGWNCAFCGGFEAEVDAAHTCSPTDQDRLDWLEANATYAITNGATGQGVIRWRAGHTTPVGGVRRVIDAAIAKSRGDS